MSSFEHVLLCIHVQGPMHIGSFSWMWTTCSSWVSPGVDPNDIYNLPQNNMGPGTCIRLILMSFYHMFCFVYMFKGHMHIEGLPGHGWHALQKCYQEWTRMTSTFLLKLPYKVKTIHSLKGYMYICLTWYMLPLVVEEQWSSAIFFRNLPR